MKSLHTPVKMAGFYDVKKEKKIRSDLFAVQQTTKCFTFCMGNKQNGFLNCFRELIN